MISRRTFCAAILLSAIALPTSAVSSEASHADNHSAPGQPKYLIFWSGPDRAAEIAERVGINNGATGEDLPRRLRDSSFGQEAMAAYHKFLKGEPLVEKAVSLDNPQLRVMAKTKQIHAALAKWRQERKEITPELQTLLTKHTELAQAAKFEELDKLCDKMLELLGAGDQGKTDVYGQD